MIWFIYIYLIHLFIFPEVGLCWGPACNRHRENHIRNGNGAESLGFNRARRGWQMRWRAVSIPLMRVFSESGNRAKHWKSRLSSPLCYVTDREDKSADTPQIFPPCMLNTKLIRWSRQGRGHRPLCCFLRGVQNLKFRLRAHRSSHS